MPAANDSVQHTPSNVTSAPAARPAHTQAAPRGAIMHDRSLDYEAPMTRAEAAHYTVGIAGYLHGMPMRERPSLPGYDSGILTLFIVAVMLVSATGRNASTLMGRLGKDLWSLRRRANAFDDNTVGELGGVMALVFLTCVCEGTLVFSWMRHCGISLSTPLGGPFTLMPLAVGVAMLYYLFQLAAYDIFGYTFTDKVGRMQWLRGFNASQSFLGLGLLVPALAGLFYPAVAPTMCVLGGGMYVAARLLFIIKGLRIFLTDFSSFLYFILYLCTLEIAPIVLIMRMCALPTP